MTSEDKNAFWTNLGNNLCQLHCNWSTLSTDIICPSFGKSHILHKQVWKLELGPVRNILDNLLYADYPAATREIDCSGMMDLRCVFYHSDQMQKYRPPRHYIEKIPRMKQIYEEDMIFITDFIISYTNVLHDITCSPYLFKFKSKQYDGYIQCLYIDLIEHCESKLNHVKDFQKNLQCFLNDTE